MHQDWYEECVEAGVRDIVKVLRDNGINTVCSCHHGMTIQCDYVVDGTLQDIYNLVYNRLAETGEELSFEIVVTISVEKGYQFPPHTVEIRLKRPKVRRGGDVQ